MSLPAFLDFGYQLSHVWDKLLHNDDQYRKSVLMKASDVQPKRRCTVFSFGGIRVILYRLIH